MKLFAAMMLMFVLPQIAVAQTIDTMAIRAHTRFLSADVLQGRGTGTRGEHIAAEYIASELIRLGVKPAGNHNFLQKIPLKRAEITAATLAVIEGTQTITRNNTRDFIWNAGGRGSLRNFSGPLLYVATADSIALRRATEARGQVVVLNGPMGAAAQAYVPALQRAGAAGIILQIADTSVYDLYVRSRGDARYFVDANVNDPVWQADLPVLISRPLVATTLPRFTTVGKSIHARITVAVTDVASANVVGIIPGSDPRRAQEIVAYSAHYDHLGISNPDARGDSIYNGFSDNAAGVAMLLAIAKEMSASPPARSVMFLFFSGEERGLLGSSYYASHPLLPLNRMKGLINLDAGAPPAPPVSWRVAGGSASPLGTLSKQIGEKSGWHVDFSPATPNSDYWPFLDRGVPSIFIIPGNQWENVNAEQQTALRARWDRYHRADDEWAADFPFSGLQRYAKLAYDVGWALATMK